MTEIGIDGARAAGIKITREPYGAGAAGLEKSLRAQLLKIREGRLDPRVKGWATRALMAAGLDGRDRPSIVTQFRCLLRAHRKQTIWVPDATKAEVIESAAVTYCEDETLCVPGTDCDGQLVALASACYTITNPATWQSADVFLVVQDFGPGIQPHVLVGVVDEYGVRHRGDPSTRGEIDEVSAARNEQWLNPLEANTLLNMPETQAELVTVGRPPTFGRGAIVTFGRAPSHAALPVGFGVRIAWGDVVVAEIQRVDVIWRSLANDVQRCNGDGQITDDEARAFFLEYNAWSLFRDAHQDPSSWQFGLGTTLDQTEKYELDAYNWQIKFKDKCKLSAPIEKPVPEAQKPLIPPIGTPETESTIRTVAVAGAVIVGIGFAGYLAFEAIQLYKMSRAARAA